MKEYTRSRMILVGILAFALFFLLSLFVTQSTVKVVQFITGINNWEYTVKEQTVVYYSDKTEMGRLGYKKEYSHDYPVFLQQAVVAVEDRRFYQHNGLDSRGIGRALWNNIKTGSKSEGGSTITQQLARTLFLSQEKTYSRKIKEVFIAAAIEDKYSKEGILNLYLNEIYMGRGCSGMQCAAQSYFGKDVMDLNEAEITLLVGMIQAPEYYVPESNMEVLKKRQVVVLEVLVEQGIITHEEAQAIAIRDVYFQPAASYSDQHPYYMAYLNEQLKELVGVKRLYQGGLKIYTTIDHSMQDAAEKSVTQNVTSFNYRGIGAKDAALISIDPQNGAIRAMVGGSNFKVNQLNMAVLPRQPGSAIKPLYYAAAINEDIITPNAVLNNKSRDFGGYSPTNYGSDSPNKVTVNEALVRSYNVASVEVLNQLGIDTACRYLQNLGISLEDGDKSLALALGGMEKGISPLQMASAFGVFPAQGWFYSCYTINSIVDENERVVYSPENNKNRVIDARTAELMDEILKNVVRNGTAANARISISSGGKTGTTSDSRDLWYIGYTIDLVTAVWVGNSDGSAVSGYSAFGGTAAAPIWRDYMNSLLYKGATYTPQAEIEIEEEQTSEEGSDSDDDSKPEETTPEDKVPDDEAVEESSPDPNTPGEEASPEGIEYQQPTPPQDDIITEMSGE
ncbi:multimodular transpeptidase-transglycosylase [hydrocarbon metagenome]|uniref:peptidoglycan glycosyltransferase n=1 Tax=hydrocarbon metagenome TaxID=938273 RepID=A0A0W8E2U9_9ZZZZ